MIFDLIVIFHIQTQFYIKIRFHFSVILLSKVTHSV